MSKSSLGFYEKSLKTDSFIVFVRHNDGACIVHDMQHNLVAKNDYAIAITNEIIENSTYTWLSKKMKTTVALIKKEKKKTVCYEVLSPDRFNISLDPIYYNTAIEVNDAVKQWVKRYERQGYYSTSNRSRIPIDEIANYCEIVYHAEMPEVETDEN